MTAEHLEEGEVVTVFSGFKINDSLHVTSVFTSVFREQERSVADILKQQHF